MKILSKLALCTGALLAFGGMSAYASLIPYGAFDAHGTGIGAVDTILAMQSNPATMSSTESGCVGWNGSTEVIGPSGCPSGSGIAGGDEKTGESQSEARTIGEVGITNAAQLLVVFNAEQSNGQPIDLTNLVLTVYKPGSSTPIFTSGAFTPMTFTSTTPGLGTSDFAFQLDSAQVNELGAAVRTAGGTFTNDVIGLAASATGTFAGPETFFLSSQTISSPPGGGAFPGGGPSSVPEPSTLLLAVGGLLFAGVTRKFRTGSR